MRQMRVNVVFSYTEDEATITAETWTPAGERAQVYVAHPQKVDQVLFLRIARDIHRAAFPSLYDSPSGLERDALPFPD